MATIEEFDFDSKNGKGPGIGGRPSKEFLEQKQALEDLKAINRIFPGSGTDFLRQFNEGRKTGSKKDLRRNIEGIAENPITKLLGPTVLGGAGIIAAIVSIWQAEEHIKDVPPILHIIVDLLKTLAVVLRGLEGYTEGLPGAIADAKEDVDKILSKVPVVDVDAVDAALFAVGPPLAIGRIVKKSLGF